MSCKDNVMEDTTTNQTGEILTINDIIQIIKDRELAALNQKKLNEKNKIAEQSDITESDLPEVPTSEPENNIESRSKVIVQVLPKVELSNISALSNFSFFGLSRKRDAAKLAGFEPKARLKSHDSDIDDSPWEEESIENGDNMSERSSVFSDEENALVTIESNVQKLGNENQNVSSKAVSEEPDQIEVDKSPESMPKGRPCRSYDEKFLIYPGDGVKLGDIETVASEIAIASGQTIRILHYVLFGHYGLTSSEHALWKSRRNILLFSGFNFSETSEIYEKKRNCLIKLPRPILSSICKILINGHLINKQDFVEDLLKFLRKPSDSWNAVDLESSTTSNADVLMKKAMMAQPFVQLRKLNNKDIEKMTQVDKAPLSQRTVKTVKRVVKLKSFSQIVINIKNARRRIVNLLHCLLYSRPGSDDSSRNKILEFSGFGASEKKVLARKFAFLSRLKQNELLQLCEVFTLRARSVTKSKKIKKLLNFLCMPSAYIDKNKSKKDITGLKDETTYSVLEKRKTGKFMTNGKTSLSSVSSKNKDGSSPDRPKVKLRDFERIRTNIECAAPENLSELNDLLFATPCDHTVIHQKILDFTSFTFNTNSLDFQYRRTLLQYMNIKTIQRISQLLDIEDWEVYHNVDELSSSILKFLMNMTMPGKKKKSSQENMKKRQKPHILTLHSYKNKKYHIPGPSTAVHKNSTKQTSRCHTPELLDSTYGSEEINDLDCPKERLSSVCYESSYSRYRHRKNGLSLKQEQILNDTTPLLDFLQHPSDTELISQIGIVMNSSDLIITMGDLVKQVLQCYPNFNLQYRIEFIKTKSLEMLQELRQNITLFPD